MSVYNFAKVRTDSVLFYAQFVSEPNTYTNYSTTFPAKNKRFQHLFLSFFVHSFECLFWVFRHPHDLYILSSEEDEVGVDLLDLVGFLEGFGVEFHLELVAVLELA